MKWGGDVKGGKRDIFQVWKESAGVIKDSEGNISEENKKTS